MQQISENFGDLLEPGLRKIFTDQYNSMPEVGPLLYNYMSTDKPYEKDSSVGAFGDMAPFNGKIAYDDVYQGYDVKYEFREFAKGFNIERKLHDDDMYGVINRKPAGLAMAAKRTKEKYAATPFNNSFTGSGTLTIDGLNVLVNSEGQALCTSGHTSNATTTTQGNAGTTSLSPSAIEATRLLGRKILDDRDNLAPSLYDTILCPPSLEETAWVIINTRGKVDTANNNRNFHEGSYKLIVWDYLTSTKDWFMVDIALMKQFLMWYNRVPLEFNQDKSFDTYIAKYSAYERYGFGWSDWRWIYGHNVA